MGESSGTDFYLELVNSEPAASLTAHGVQIPAGTIPVSAVKKYLVGAASGAPTTTVIAMAANSHLSAVDDAYNGMYLVGTSGVNEGVRRLISDYVGASRTFTVAAFGTAPAAGDTFAIVRNP